MHLSTNTRWLPNRLPFLNKLERAHSRTLLHVKGIENRSSYLQSLRVCSWCYRRLSSIASSVRDNVPRYPDPCSRAQDCRYQLEIELLPVSPKLLVFPANKHWNYYHPQRLEKHGRIQRSCNTSPWRCHQRCLCLQVREDYPNQWQEDSNHRYF